MNVRSSAKRGAGPLKRRGLLAGAAALTSGLVAKLGTAERAEATHGGANDIIGGGFFNNIGNGFPTVIYNSATNAPAISGSNGFLPGTASASFVNTPDGTQGITNKEGGGGVRGTGLTYGVIGQVNRGSAPLSHFAIGVLGQTQFGAGVRGEIFGGGNGTGVVGVASGCELGNANDVGVAGSGRGAGANIGNKTGMLGITDGSLGVGVQGWAIGSGTGIRGSSNAGGGPDFNGSGTGVDGRSGSGYGIFGISQSGFGVFGGANTGTGVYANSNTTTGVYATAPQKAVWGRTTTGIGVFGQATGTTATTFGIYGYAAAPAWAGYFEGNVYVTGQLVVNGRTLSPAQGADGAAPALQSVEASEPVVEDFGEAKLANGHAVVTLGADFVAAAAAGSYQVFLTEYGDGGGLFVAGRTPATFEVRSRTGGSGAFGYRVLAKRKAMSGARTAALERPKGLDAKQMEPPTPPEPPKVEPTTPVNQESPSPELPKPGNMGQPNPEPPRPGRQDAR